MTDIFDIASYITSTILVFTVIGIPLALILVLLVDIKDHLNHIRREQE